VINILFYIFQLEILCSDTISAARGLEIQACAQFVKCFVDAAEHSHLTRDWLHFALPC
jgi:hypothetical protein